MRRGIVGMRYVPLASLPRALLDGRAFVRLAWSIALYFVLPPPDRLMSWLLLVRIISWS